MRARDRLPVERAIVISRARLRGAVVAGRRRGERIGTGRRAALMLLLLLAKLRHVLTGAIRPLELTAAAALQHWILLLLLLLRLLIRRRILLLLLLSIAEIRRLVRRRGTWCEPRLHGIRERPLRRRRLLHNIRTTAVHHHWRSLLCLCLMLKKLN